GYFLGSPNHHSGWSLSSAHRSFDSLSGSQKALGSPTWIDTGIPSSPQRFQTASSLGSSTLISWPLPSRRVRPSRLNSLSPVAPNFLPRVICSAASSLQSGSSQPE